MKSLLKAKRELGKRKLL